MRLDQNPACNPECTACHYKGFDYEEQLRRKQAWALENLGSWREFLKPIIPAPETERLAYRSKSWLRSSFENEVLSFGMHRAKQVDGTWEQEFVSWNTCPIHVPAIQEMIGRLRETLVHHARDFCAESLFGIWMGSPHLVIVARELELDRLRTIDWNELLVAPFNRVWGHRTNQVGRKVFQHRHFHQIAGPPIGDDHPILAFRQIAQTLLTEARELALTHLLKCDPSLVVDLYCGTGELARLLPTRVSWIGIELTQDAAEYAGAFIGTVEERLRDPRVLEKVSGSYALYMNPPRAGLSAEAQKRVLAMIQANPPGSLVILSCSASSLGRDLKAIESTGFKVTLLQPYDFFPQTEHFETVAVLTASL